jgi:glutamate-1-semialdehyde 2,1-aminomutase
VRNYVIVLPFNNIHALEAVLNQRHQDIAAVILEPVNYNSGTILPLPGYLESVRELTAKYGVLLIFDEILSGFQTGSDCMQGYFHVTPDLTTLGKALGAGMPLSALVGKREIMEKLAPLGKAMHSGTYIAHPTSILAAIAFLTEIDRAGFYPALLGQCSYLIENVRSIFQKAGMTVKVPVLGARFSLLFGIAEEQHVTNYRDAALHDRRSVQQFYAMMLEEGIYFNPGWHHGICAAHTTEQMDRVLESVERVVRRMIGEKSSLKDQVS